MASIDKLIREKTDRLETVPDHLLTRLQKLQKEIFPIVIELVSRLERDSEGFVLFNQNNVRISGEIREQLRRVLLTSEYTEIVADFADEFNIQQGVTDELIKATFPEFIPGGLASDIVAQSKKKTVEIFINGITDEAFADAIAEEVTLAVNNNGAFTDTLKMIRQIVTGDEDVDSKIQQYAQQVAHDQFALADRAYTSQVSEEIGAEWFFYSGSEIKTTRPFCAERHNQYFYYKEIERWGEGYKTEGLSLPNKNGDWGGKIDGTNEKTIFTTAGGWNCRHSIIPASIFVVPKEVIQRNIKEGYFKPSEFEVKELGISLTYQTKTKKMKPDFSKMTKEEIAAHKANYIANRHPNQPRQMTKKEINKMNQRNSESTHSIYGDMTMEEINRMNAKNNLPSSLK